EQIAKRVTQARKLQYARESNGGMLNGALSTQAIRQTAGLTDAAKTLLDDAAERLRLSARPYMRAVKVARTIADLDTSEVIAEQHVAEALQYRPRTVAL